MRGALPPHSVYVAWCLGCGKLFFATVGAKIIHFINKNREIKFAMQLR